MSTGPRPPVERRTEDLPAYVDAPPPVRRDERSAWFRELPTQVALAGLWTVVAPILVGVLLLTEASNLALGGATLAAALVLGALRATATRVRRGRRDLARYRLRSPLVWGWSSSAWRRRGLRLVLVDLLGVAVLGGFVAVALAVPSALRSMPPPLDQGPALVGATAGAALVLAAERLVGAVRLRRVERRTGRWVVAVRHRSGWALSTTYAADGLVVAGTSWRVTLPAPLAECDLSAFRPFERWAVLMAAGRLDDALALAERGSDQGVHVGAALAAVTCVARGRVPEAERWIQRLVDAGYHGEVDPPVARVLAPLHRSPAWRALMVQTRGGRGAGRRLSPR